MPVMHRMQMRRGSSSIMASEEKRDLILEPGELFLEYPADGIESGPMKIKIGDGVHKYYELPYLYENQTNKIDELESRMNRTYRMIHNCFSCGGKLQVEENKPVIHCPYCGSAYIIGPTQLLSTY